jgi:hypothetical protein
MNLFELLKQFKNIKPDAAFSETSKRAIFAMNPREETARAAGSIWGSPRRTFLRLIETGVAVALTGFFILLITGALSGSRFAPVQYSAIDPQGLRAEADAIDIQIQLANLNYTAPSAPESTTPLAVGGGGTGAGAGNGSGAITTPPMAAAEATSSADIATTTLSIDQALQGLAN